MFHSVHTLRARNCYGFQYDMDAMEGDPTNVVSAASGAVGQLVGQIAKLAGCRAVAVAGDDNKLHWCREIGFDAAIN
jgi:NADPH-dependent curcumin reductase CurA